MLSMVAGGWFWAASLRQEPALNLQQKGAIELTFCFSRIHIHVFSLVNKFPCQQDIAKTYQQIYMVFGGEMQSWANESLVRLSQ